MLKSVYLPLIILTITTLQSHAQLWSGVNGETVGWKHSDWFGSFWSPSRESGWLYHETLGWLYAEGDSQSDIEIYTTDLAWLYTNESLYPVFYSYSKDDWLNYVPATNPDTPYWYSYGEGVFVERSSVAITIQVADLAELAQDGNHDARREYFWTYWVYVTEIVDGGIPRFETWFTRDDVFSEDGVDLGANLHQPRQHQNLDTDSNGTPGSITSLFFNEALTDYIRSNEFYYEQTFIDLVEEYNEEGLTGIDRALVFPESSIGLKPIWFPILNRTDTTYRIMPVWDGDPQYPVTDSTPDAVNPPLPSSDNSTLGFKTAVLVDVSGDEISDGTTETISWNGDDDYEADVVSINDFYYQIITEETLDDAYSALEDQYPDLAEELAVGDYLMLVGMHLLPEATPVTYGTLWWHDDPDYGEYASLRPDSVTGVFANYVLDGTFLTDTNDSYEYDGTGKVVFNPYLEAYKAGGVASNCVFCHVQAGYGFEDPSPAPRTGLEDAFDTFNDSVGFGGWWVLVYEVISAADDDQ
ncbi:hypothetical protein [Rubellicoccus peritrichatus]|uniref:Uncharacterized protein n=1 Tax=Rubellicoccus peritrichatus TaxID=3080537 RepID=A0AAQ3QWP9_9BACT|nr:hypothetical protein [Puniceicoccus sp. CR14]WOO42122.1 hypothetical protein RZN69_03410 [Puniceicoccus sp. CR14]